MQKKGKKMKEKILYFWNDLGIFFPQKIEELKEVDKLFKKYFERITRTEGVVYNYITLQDTKDWQKSVKQYVSEACIYLGTRPNKLFANRNAESIEIFPHRERYLDGRTKVAILSENDKEKIKKYVMKGDTIRIIEDVLVCGVTMNVLLKEISKYLTNDQDIFIEFFLKNSISADILEKEIGNRLHIKSYYEMQGESIRESTCICAYDILKGKFNDMEYSEYINKLQYFFGQYTYEVLEIMKLIRKKFES